MQVDLSTQADLGMQVDPSMQVDRDRSGYAGRRKTYWREEGIQERPMLQIGPVVLRHNAIIITHFLQLPTGTSNNAPFPTPLTIPNAEPAAAL